MQTVEEFIVNVIQQRKNAGNALSPSVGNQTDLGVTFPIPAHLATDSKLRQIRKELKKRLLSRAVFVVSRHRTKRFLNFFIFA